MAKKKEDYEKKDEGDKTSAKVQLWRQRISASEKYREKVDHNHTGEVALKVIERQAK
jgi:hypothetical protein